ncbi:hypothetical protein [Azospirillum halopraeferens]|uniref:hypothetical protein n=1 Tax=Azospirillum halopraeferens TaxID=34010 RepID=UPI000415C483|nr:hypothetical protein [Azospirillum halopraeferens]
MTDAQIAGTLEEVLGRFDKAGFRPTYRAMAGERWRLQVVPYLLSRGYWSGPMMITDMAVLTRTDDRGARRTWMSITPMEIESQEIGCRFASGHTVVMGLGMGWATVNAAVNPAVDRVTVVEMDDEVRSMIAAQGIIEQLPEAERAKVTVVAGDAMEYVPDAPAETLLADIWLPLNGDERVEQVRRMQANTGARRVYFWGQEMVIARHARKAGRPIDHASVADAVAATRLPLIGPAEVPDYPDLIARATHWLRED